MRKAIAVILTLAMVLSAIPTSAFAQVKSPKSNDISSASIEDIADKTYTGKEITLTEEDLKVTLDDTPLTLDTDFTVSYEGNTDAGEATVTLTGQGSYTGTLTANFTIVPKEFSMYDLPNIEIPHQMVSPDDNDLTGVKVTWDDITLTESTDYTVSGDRSTTGTKDAVFTFQGNYTGSVTAIYRVISDTINDADLEIVEPEGGFVFSGEKIMPEVIVTKDETVLEKDADYQVFYENNLNAGTATAVVWGAGEYGGELTKDFAIEKAALADAAINLEKDAYPATGEAIEPEFTVTLGEYTLAEDEYTVSYEDNTAAGTGKIVLTAQNKNFTGTLSRTFTITGRQGSITADADSYVKYLTSKTFNLNASTDTDASGLTYSSSDENVAKVSDTGDVTIGATGKAVITIKTEGTQQYDPAEKQITIEVKPLKPAFSVSSPAKGKIRVSIDKVEGATKYQVHYGRMGKYYNRYYAHKEDGKDTLTVTIDKRLKNKNYFVKIRSYKTLEDGTKVWGNWTVIRKVKTK